MVPTMATTIDPGKLEVAQTRGASTQWMGVQWLGGFFALPLSCVAAVLRAARSEQQAAQMIVDVEIHEGAAVFMRSFADCFAIQAQSPQGAVDETHDWVLVMDWPTISPIGCRVHHVVGPFWAEHRSEFLTHDGQDWRPVLPLGGAHA